MNLIEEIKSKANKLSNTLIKIRREFHANPELSFQEFETQKRVIKYLEQFGFTDIKICAKTGVVALLKGNNPEQRTISLRGDMDALPITELNEIDYKSINEGVMHACGHDVHTTCLLGAAHILKQLKGKLNGQIKFIFQPGEEKLPGGASIMIKEKVLENPKVESMLGQHVMPLIDVGKVGFRSGLYMASADEIYITVKGKGGHAAHPHQNIDPIAISAQLITSLQQIVSRRGKPSIPSVLSIGKVIANGATNIIPSEVKMEGTFRTFDEPWRDTAHELIKYQTETLVKSMGGVAIVEIKKGYPCLKNDTEVAKRNKEWAKDYLGENNVEELELWPAGEDFAFFSQKVPSCFYRLGIRNKEKGITSMLHTPTFNIDESAIEIGSGLMAWLAINELNNGK